jgi:hypothetical protein
MNDKFNTLPFPDDNEKFVTPPELEDALPGIKKDLENKLLSHDDFEQFVTSPGLEDALPGIKKDLENKLLSHDDFEQFVTSPGLEDASQGIKQSRENLQQPTERVVIKISSQTTDDGSDAVVSYILYQYIYFFFYLIAILCHRKLESA